MWVVWTNLLRHRWEMFKSDHAFCSEHHTGRDFDQPAVVCEWVYSVQTRRKGSRVSSPLWRTLSQTTKCDDLKNKLRVCFQSIRECPEEETPTNTHTHMHTHRQREHAEDKGTNKHPCIQTPMFTVLSAVSVCLNQHNDAPPCFIHSQEPKTNSRLTAVTISVPS